jgi:hypothetical protein
MNESWAGLIHPLLDDDALMGKAADSRQKLRQQWLFGGHPIRTLLWEPVLLRNDGVAERPNGCPLGFAAVSNSHPAHGPAAGRRRPA